MIAFTHVGGKRKAGLFGALLAAAALLAGCERPPVDTVQRGHRGTAMVEVYNPRTLAAMAPNNAVPDDSPPAPSDGPKSSTAFQNVQVLGELSVAEFTRTMVSMTAWVSPQQGCTYCHNPANFAEDKLYTKVVARRMLQMTKHINTDWKTHVAETGVTCYTCHRGQPVPANVWFSGKADNVAAAAGNKAGQNAPATTVGLASLPNDPFTPFLQGASDIRVIGTSALPDGNRASTKQTEWTYGLMVHMSESLGVNCTYCHNTRSFSEWSASTPQRTTAWYGIRLARDVNTNYLDSLAGVFPANRLGPNGDVPKLNCATCHQGAFKPLYGASMAQNHPELLKVSLTASSKSAGAAVPAAATLFFAVGSPALADDAAKSLEPVIAALKTDPAAKVTISGYHSAAGDLAQNQELAKQRAFAVRDALKAAGATDEQVVLEKPQTAEANLSGEDPKARRVELAIAK